MNILIKYIINKIIELPRLLLVVLLKMSNFVMLLFLNKLHKVVRVYIIYNICYYVNTKRTIYHNGESAQA